MRKKRLVLLFLLLISSGNFAQNRLIEKLNFNQLSTLNGLPTNEVQKVYQDKNGYIWIATRSGLCQYDGYQVKTYKSNLYTPNLLASNNVHCMAEDDKHNLLIGTLNGLNIMNKKTGEIRFSACKALNNNVISTILISKDYQIWIGTDRGLYQYDCEKDSCSLYNWENSKNVLPRTAIKSLCEDSKGCIWIGTWSNGFYRYDPKSQLFHAYPKINRANSAHVIFEDSRKRIWIGTWGEGLYLLENPYDPQKVSWKNFRHNSKETSSLSDNIVYAISEDINTHSLWIGTRSGLSIQPKDNSLGAFINYLPESTHHPFSNNEVNSIIRDNSGMMWLGTIGGGVSYVNTRDPQFNLYQLESIKNELSTNSVKSMLVDNEGLVWMGIGTYGLAVHNRKTGHCTYHAKLPEFADTPNIPTVNVIMQTSKKEVWFGTYNGGIYIYSKGRKVINLHTENTPHLVNSCIYSLMEDSKGNCWVGTRSGLSILSPNRKAQTFASIQTEGEDNTFSSFVTIEEDHHGAFWLGTNNSGIIRAVGSTDHPEKMQFTSYSLSNQKINCNNIQFIHEDSKHRLWAGTEGGGLNLYDPKKNTFNSMNLAFNLPGDIVTSMQEDQKGDLWLGTNFGLVKLSIPQEVNKASYRLYTMTDGLQDNFFVRNACFKTKDGELFFGGYKGYNSFYPDQLQEHEISSPTVITDIKIFNKSLNSLDSKSRQKISAFTPEFAKTIQLSYRNNNFSIEFANLSYTNPMQNKYAYKLDGFDKEWQYTDASRRFAYYNNLGSGSYTFYIKAANENGIWNASKSALQIEILPPPWKTGWAYTLYLLLTVSLTYFLLQAVRNRIQLKNALQIRELEQAKSEELNRAKLQFFTNITHELLTPLTIISASLDELKVLSPQNKEYHTIMGNNISRLIRLLQQILEFRKAETGNLKLKVSKADLAAFIRKGVDSFRPLIKKKKLHFSVVCDPEQMPCYFDSDKMDKILYNLLSNASKYNGEGGFVQININYDSTLEKAILTVKDNGKGISPQAMKTLFKRFYEGNYRHFNTIGTGIGLSLTKDLVELHNGTITVESEVDFGTSFQVIIPIVRTYYQEDQIDNETIIPVENIENLPVSISHPQVEKELKERTVLVVEDNEDLLQLMVKLLSREYNILTAQNGKEAILVIENEEIDLIVSDIMMPEMDGIELCQYVKNNFSTCHIPIILLTAKNKEKDRIEAYDSGADGFISKPFNLTVLHSKIKNLLKNKERMAKDFKKQLVFEIKELNYTSMDEEFLQQAIDCVHAHLSNPDFDQLQFMEAMKASKSTLYKKLKSLTGLNTSAFIRNIRLKAACKIVEEKKHIRISELAYAVGFNDPKYFSACFKKEFGMLPSEYLEREMPEPEVSEE